MWGIIIIVVAIIMIIKIIITIVIIIEAVLGESRLSHARVVEFSQGLQAWRQPRLAPLIERRRRLLEHHCWRIGYLPAI